MWFGQGCSRYPHREPLRVRLQPLIRPIYLTNDFYRGCFLRYVATKVFKRVEATKIRADFKDVPNRLLLPISLGVSSLSLLHVLDQQIQFNLAKNGRAGFTLHLLFVEQAFEADHSVTKETLRLLQERFPLHAFSVIHLSDIFHYPLAGLNGLFELEAKGQDRSPLSNEDRLKHLLSSLPSASSRSDITATLRGRLLSVFAQRHDCFGIVYGDSTTRLAERTLSETAKGRGGSLPWLTADSLSPIGTRIFYPMRDLLKKELLTYTEFIDPPLASLIVPDERPSHGAVSAKDSTIDSLMSQYFSSVEEKFPSIVANVVRTSGRLLASRTTSTLRSCRICGSPIENSVEARAGYQELPPASNGTGHTPSLTEPSLCYGCIRTMGAGNVTLNSP